jgi:pantoate--beta-alanine ligase
LFRLTVVEQIDSVGALRAQVREWRGQGLRIGFVPTMGNLHAGHYSLIELASQHADRVVASIFVNPAQFGPNEDFAVYPRTPERDAEGLQAAGCAALFTPEVDTMYPYGLAGSVRVEVPGLSDVLCGTCRPGHFAGVATVVLRLLNMAQPDVAVFGRKDLQQLQVIRHLVRELALPVEILAAPTRREPSGLALSSRNQYLTEAERPRAVELSRALRGMLEMARRGEPVEQAEAAGLAHLRAAGMEPDYAVLRRESGLAVPLFGPAGFDDLVALGAARLGRTRLIDNWALSDI